MPRKVKERAFVVIGFALVLASILVEFSFFNDFFCPFFQLIAHQQYVRLVLNCLLLCMSIGGVFVAVFADRGIIRSLILPVLLGAFLFNLGSYQISHAPLDFQHADNIVRHFRCFFWCTVENFGLEVLPLFLLFIPLTVGIDLLPKKFPFRFPKRSIYVTLASLLLVCVSFFQSLPSFDRFPGIYRVPALLLFAAYNELYDQGRYPVTYHQETQPKVEQLIVVVDESIRADMLGINNDRLKTTPYLSSLKSSIINCGLSASSSNCSDSSNLVLRTGLRVSEIPDIEQRSLRSPSIWQYAQHAGYKTYYMDAQHGKNGHLQNFMNGKEIEAIDHIIFAKHKDEPHYSDITALKSLAAILERKEKVMVFMNKYGVHFPYSNSYPEEQRVFEPTLRRGESMKDRPKALNTYKNGLRWAVDTWFNRFFTKQMRLQNYLIIYTSDHGQNIMDNGTLCTHCCPGSRTTRFEGIVPMILFSDRDDLLQSFQDIERQVYNRTSHFQVFPTMLIAMGYEEDWVCRRYGPSLLQEPDHPPQFFTGDIHGRGSTGKWVPIEP